MALEKDFDTSGQMCVCVIIKVHLLFPCLPLVPVNILIPFFYSSSIITDRAPAPTVHSSSLPPPAAVWRFGYTWKNTQGKRSAEREEQTEET